MPSLSYKKQFILPLIDHTKRGTIRKKRKRPIKHGDKIYHYTAMRTKSCAKIGESECVLVRDIKIDVKKNRITVAYLKVNANKSRQKTYDITTIEALNAFAIGDGFENWKAMRDFWLEYHGPRIFRGDWITHTPITNINPQFL